ncbi:hypothetical protein FOE78_01555 [Microlunatus elymi]|uniref:AAA domain-containing protein n=1 Tax=Microlunatus elymi TaxID=2596828 RepID=A0A516PUA6_9ACTN|nr:hypothetical protein [Microlunatus elymi]QDP94774.1 hypothetical protein FOE78_01555 [Microlunatus elymi]
MITSQSITSSGADILRSIAKTRQSFLVHALPQGAGKTTLVQAILAEVPDSVPRDEFFGTEEERQTLAAAEEPGYLLVAEIGHHGRPGYLAGPDVPRIFDLLTRGYSLASSLHADTVDQVFEVLAANGVPAAVAATVPYLITVRMIRNQAGTRVRRVVDEIHNLTTDGSGEPSAARLYRWDGQPEDAPNAWVEEPEHDHQGPRHHR